MPGDSGGVPRPTGGRAPPHGMMYDSSTRAQQLVAMVATLTTYTTLATGANAPLRGGGHHRDGPCAESPWNVLGGSANGVGEIICDRNRLGFVRLEGYSK